MGEEKKKKKRQSPPFPLSNIYHAAVGGALTLPMGVQGPPYRSGVDGHKNARHGFLAGFPAVSL